MSTDIKTSPKEVKFEGIFEGLAKDGSGIFQGAGTVILTKTFYKCMMADGRIYSMPRSTSKLALYLNSQLRSWVVEIGDGPKFQEKSSKLLREKYLQLVDLAEA